MVKKFKTFGEAKEFIQTFNIKSFSEFKSKRRIKIIPQLIPASPDHYYKNQGWISWGDFLGCGNKGCKKTITFEEAKEVVKTFNLSSSNEYQRYFKEGKIPDYLPSDPSITYKNKGWLHWGDFLGKGNKGCRKKINFKEARKIARSLNLLSSTEYRHSYDAGKIPYHLAAYPHITYKNKGWKGWKDFLGK